MHRSVVAAFLEDSAMTRTRLALAWVALALWVSLAAAEPRLVLRYAQGVPRVSITGDYARSTYTVSRAPANGGAYEPLSQGSVLCMGECYALDPSALPGTSYFYRFDLLLPDGTAASYGPFLATISPALARPLGVFVFPNPGHGPATVQLHVAGAPAAGAVLGEAALFDLSGRRVRVIHQGAFERGLTTWTWDGRDDRGRN